MPAARGSRQQFRAVREVTFGTTPTNPTLIEMPVVNFNRNINRNVIRSNQIRSHPFTDRLMRGQLNADFDFQVELQDDTHDLFLDVMCGGTTWASNALKVTDALQGISFEAMANDLTLYDQMAGGFLTSMEVNFPAEENGIVTASFNGMAKSVTLDSSTSLIGTGSVTAAPANDPFVFQDATVSISTVARPVTALSLRLERQVNPLFVLGSPTPREYIPAETTLTGQITIPLETNAESQQLVNFTEMALVARAANAAGTGWREFTLPKINFTRMGRQVQDRGVILQTIDWEAKYDTTSATIMSITRSA